MSASSQLTINSRPISSPHTHRPDANGVVYLDLLLDLTQLDVDDLPLLPLFQRMLLETGLAAVGGEGGKGSADNAAVDRVDLSRRIQARTGGVGASMTTLKVSASATGLAVSDPDDIRSYFVLSGKSTPAHP